MSRDIQLYSTVQRVKSTMEIKVISPASLEGKGHGLMSNPGDL